MPGERTEQATQHRREQARKDGDILHSRELSAAAGTLAGVVALGMAVRGVTGTAIAAAAIALPTVRFSRGKIAELLPALTETVEGIRSDIIGLGAPKRRSPA